VIGLSDDNKPTGGAMKYTSILAAVALATAAFAADAKDKAVDTAAAFSKLKTLAGEWEATVDGKTARLIYEVTGAGTTLVEKETGDAHPEMMTMYHLNGSRLIPRHAVMREHQARSVEKTGTLRFEFLD